MPQAISHWLYLLFLIPICIGCSSEEEPFRKQTLVVTGTVTVDGVPPDTALQLQCHPAGSIDEEHPSMTSGITDDIGNFELSTYEKGDGIPPGEYVLTFAWKKYNVMSNGYSGPDQLNGRYSDAKKSEIKVSVSGTEPIDLGIIELKTKD